MEQQVTSVNIACDLFLHLILTYVLHKKPSQRCTNEGYELKNTTYPFWIHITSIAVIEYRWPPVSPPGMNIVAKLSAKLLFKFVPSRTACTDLNGEDSCVSDQERFDLEGLAEGSSLVHGAHGCCLVCIDVFPQLLSAQKNTQLQLQVFSPLSSNSIFSNQVTDKTMWNRSKSCGNMLFFTSTLKGKVIQMRTTSQGLTLTSPQLWAALPEPWGRGWSHLLKWPAQFRPVGRNTRAEIHSSNTDFQSFILTAHYFKNKNENNQFIMKTFYQSMLVHLSSHVPVWFPIKLIWLDTFRWQMIYWHEFCFCATVTIYSADACTCIQRYILTLTREVFKEPIFTTISKFHKAQIVLQSIISYFIILSCHFFFNQRKTNKSATKINKNACPVSTVSVTENE